MKSFNFIVGRAQLAIAVALLAGAGLSGCHSSNDDHGNNGGGGGPPSPPAPVTDAFFRTVSSFISASSETAEDSPIDAFATTSPENTEPESLG